MGIIVTGYIQVKDSNDKVHTIDISDMDFSEGVTTELKPSGTVKTYFDKADWGNFTVIITVKEYPENTYDSHKIDIVNGELIEDNLRVEFDEDE